MHRCGTQYAIARDPSLEANPRDHEAAAKSKDPEESALLLAEHS
ncbi:hypothetical protein ACIF8W_28825 [Streptomyces sp. NPDC085639]